MSKNSYRKIYNNFFSLSIVQGTNFLIPIIIMPHVINKIGIAWFGVVSIAQVLMVYLSTVSDYGFNLTATREIALNRDEKQSEKISKIFSTVLSTKICITLFLFLFLLLLTITLPFFRHNLEFYISGFTYVIGQALLVSWFFQGMEKMKYITYSILIARIIFAFLVFIFIRDPSDAILFLFFFGLSNIVAGLFSIFLAIHIFKLKFLLPRQTDIIKELVNGWQITISNIFINTYLYSNIFVLRFFANDIIVGYYSIAEKIFFTIRQILGVFSQVIYPHVCQLVQKGRSKAATFFKEVYVPFLFFVIIVSGVVFILSHQIIQIFSDDGSNLPGILLRILSIVPVIVCLNIPAYQILLSLDRKKSYFRILSLGTIVNFGLNMLLAGLWSATGTTVAIVITEIFITIGLNWELYKNNLTTYIKEKAK